ATSGQFTFAKEADRTFPEKHAADIYALLAKEDSTYRSGSFMMNMTSNHDLNSWEGTEFERLGNLSGAFAALSYTLPGMPLIYTGQEIGFDHRFAFFEKDPISAYEPNEWTAFYRKLNALRHACPALASGEKAGEMAYMAGAVADVMAFTRTAGDDRVVCLFNLSAEPQQVVPTVEVAGDFTDALDGKPRTIVSGGEFALAPWEYAILVQ
ncbi:MAG: DUF3459 domain-containing protein, partial [Alistipes sp.]|nr:DUF3459 domain-containing protein [Alistipes sp.]